MNPYDNPYDIVAAFEEAVAEYAGAKYGVAVNSCTSALMLACRYRFDQGYDRCVEIPRYTYVGVAQAIHAAGGWCEFRDENWSGGYWLDPISVFDGARRFLRGMYTGVLHCLSFHMTKHLPIGRGGMILTDCIKERDSLRRMRYDGRMAGVAPKDDNFDFGWHVGMTPEEAARGLQLMTNVKDGYVDIPGDDYAYLSKTKWFSEPGGM